MRMTAAGSVLWRAALQGDSSVCGSDCRVLLGTAALPGGDRPPAALGGGSLPSCQREGPV